MPDFGWGLPIVENAELVRMVPAPLDEPHSDIAIHMDASEGVRAPVPTTVEFTLRGDAAIGTNQALANFTGEARDRALREFWRQRFDFIEPDKVGLAFDKEAIELRLTLEGRATMDWNGVWYETDETGLGYNADFSREPGPGSDAPYAVGHPFYTRTRQTIVLPPGFAAPTSDDLNVDETVAGVEYKRTTTFADNTLFVEASERSIAPEFPAEDAPAFEERLRELADNEVYLRIPTDYRPTEADVATAIEEEPTDAQGFVDQAVMLMDRGRFDEAVAKLESATDLEPDNAWAWANRGVSLAQMNRLEDAEEALDRALAIDPENWVVYNGRGLLAERKLDFPAAIAAFTKVIELNPENAFAWGHRATANLSANNPERALEDAAQALKLSPSYAQMHSLRAFTFVTTGKRAEAEAEIEAMLAASPESPFAISTAGEIYKLLGQDDKARALFDRTIADAPTAMAYYGRSELRDPSDSEGRLADIEQALLLSPDFAPALAARATLRAETGDVEGALADATEAIRLNPAQHNLYVVQADLARRQGLTDVALDAAAALVELNPDSRPAMVEAGRIYARLGKYEEAVSAVDKALAILPEPYLYIDRSRVRDPADFDARMADIEEALRLAPTYNAALVAKAHLLAERGDHQAAARALGQALAREQNNPALLVERGIALSRLGSEREAERDFAQAREMAQDAQGLNNICYLKAVAGVALERALEECNESLRLLPDYAPTLDSRGTVLLRMGRLDEAIADFDRVLEKEPELAQSRYLRAVARSRQGDLAGARSDAEAARAASPAAVAELERQGFILVGIPELAAQ